MVDLENQDPRSSSEAEAAKSEPVEDGNPSTSEIPKHEIDAIIRKRVYASMALGLAPIPIIDLAGLTFIQIELVHSLAQRFGVPFRSDLAKTIICSLLGSVLPTSLAPALASLAKFIPIIGWSTSAVSMSLLGAGATYALGKIFTQHFESGGTLLDFNVDKVRSAFQSKFKEGKEIASGMKQEQRHNA